MTFLPFPVSGLCQGRWPSCETSLSTIPCSSVLATSNHLYPPFSDLHKHSLTLCTLLPQHKQLWCQAYCGIYGVLSGLRFQKPRGGAMPHNVFPGSRPGYGANAPRTQRVPVKAPVPIGFLIARGAFAPCRTVDRGPCAGFLIVFTILGGWLTKLSSKRESCVARGLSRNDSESEIRESLKPRQALRLEHVRPRTPEDSNSRGSALEELGVS